MGTLTCSRCNATIETDSIEEGRKRLDHAVGLGIGKPCEDGRAELILTGVKPKNVRNSKPKTDSIPKDKISKDVKSKSKD